MLGWLAVAQLAAAYGLLAAVLLAAWAAVAAAVEADSASACQLLAMLQRHSTKLPATAPLGFAAAWQDCVNRLLLLLLLPNLMILSSAQSCLQQAVDPSCHVSLLLLPLHLHDSWLNAAANRCC